MSDLAIVGIAYAEVNWGRWIAQCPRPGCTNAMGLEPGQELFACLGPDSCGWQSGIIWPPDTVTIEAILEMRPFSRHRNWTSGESLEALLAENAAHDCLSPELLAAAEANPGLPLLATVDGRAVDGLLHHQLEAAGRREIGA